MPLFKSRASHKNEVDALLESIAKGQFDDDTIKELKRRVDTAADSEVDRVAESLLSIIMKNSDTNVLIGTVKALTVMPFLPEGKDEHIIRLMVTMFAVPQNTVITLQHKLLQNEILKFLLSMLKTDQLYAPIMMPELIASLEYGYIAKDAEAYPALEALAISKPEYFRPHAETLVKFLGSINKTTRAQSAKLIGIIGSKYPEYVSSAMPVLQSLASFYPDALVKHNASEAYQVLYHGLRLDAVETVVMKEDDRPKQHSMGFADILKKKATDLLSKPPQDMPGARQRAARERLANERSISAKAAGNLISKPPVSQEAETETDKIPLADMEGFESEIKSILDKTRDDFSNDAEGILNSIGVGHLSIKSRDKLTITSSEKRSRGVLPSAGGIASQPPEADKLPIHARSSLPERKSKLRVDAENAVQSKAAEPAISAYTEKSPAESIGVNPVSPEPPISPVKTGANLRGDAGQRNVHVPSGLVRTSASEKKPESSDATKLPRAGTKAKQAGQAVTTPASVTEKKDKPVKESAPQAKRVTLGTEKQEAHEPKGPEEPASKRVEKAIAWFEKVGVPQSAPEETHHVRTPQQHAAMESKATPEPQHRTTHDGPAPQHEAKPDTVRPQPEAATTSKVGTVPEKHALSKHEHKIESSVLPPKAAVSRHEKILPLDPITPPVARKISVSGIGMMDKPLESYGSTEKKEAVVPVTSISGFGPNKRIYKCPKCGARTLAEGELCMVCKMTMERPQETVHCERCGTMNDRNTRFCRKCGAKL